VTPEEPERSDPNAEPAAPPLGIADAHGVISIAASLGVLGMSVVCCFDRVEDEYLLFGTFAVAVIAVWTGLFGVLTHGTPYGRGLAALGLAAIVLASSLLCFGASTGWVR